MTGATQKGTQRYFHSRGLPSRVLGKTNWSISSMGFGGYRVALGVPEHEEALSNALSRGINLIDTSTNYGDGQSERLMGKVLASLIGEKKLSRDEVVVVSKVGYLQGKILEEVQSRKKYSDLVKFHEECWHCISPDFIEDQLSRSLERLGLQTIDVYLLHNPEYYLKTHSDPEEYYARIRKALIHLESEVKRGRIQCYGISSNTFPSPENSKEFTSLSRICRSIESELGPENHFWVIQFPFNLFEMGAAIHENNQGMSLIDFAQKKSIGTLINRPLNAFNGNRMIRLSSFSKKTDSEIRKDLNHCFLKAKEVEAGAPKGIPIERMAWSQILESNLSRIRDLFSWKDLLSGQIRPVLNQDAQVYLKKEDAVRSWFSEYLQTELALFESLTDFFESALSDQSEKIEQTLVEQVPSLEKTEGLNQKSLQTYLSIPGIDCVLVGMREAKYVEDVFQVPQEKLPVSEVKRLFGNG